MSDIVLKLIGDDLPEDVYVTRFDANEAISVPYEVMIEFTTRSRDFVVSTMLRKGFQLSVVDQKRARTRNFAGVCDAAEFIDADEHDLTFRIRLRPPIAALAHGEDCRIFQEKSIVDVVKEIFTSAGVEKVEWRLQKSYGPKEFIVQYRESHLDFVSRLLENDGIFYFFVEVEGEMTMVLGDDVKVLSEPHDPEVLFGLSQGLGADVLSRLSRTRRLRSSDARLRDYDFEKPATNPSAAVPSTGAELPLQHYDYPGGFVDPAEGAQRAGARIASLRHDADTIEGSSDAFIVMLGHAITIDGSQQENLNGKFIVTELRTRGSQSPTGGRGGESSAENVFVAIPDAQPYAPPRRAKKPLIHGIQTAKVTAPTQEEESIHVDKYGRIKVRFYWDRVGQFDDKSSCWLRVVQLPLGGSMILPRVGWEVSVAFLEGDPDRPMVLGRVYNAERTPPYALPGAQASGAIKSHSSPGGAGMNEINFGDSGGGQGFSMHAQKDLNMSVLNDKSETIGGNEKHVVKVNMKVEVGGDETVSVGGNQDVSVGDVASAKVTGSISVSVGGNENDNATSNYVSKAGASRTYDVGGNMTIISNTVVEEIVGNLTRDVGTAVVTAALGSIGETVGGDITENISIAKVDLCKGTYGQTVGGAKTLTSLAADVHLVTGSLAESCDASVMQLIGIVHYQKIGGDYSVSAPLVTLVGATGAFKGGGSELKLGGGPVLLKGGEVTIDTLALLKFGSSMKMG